MSMIVPNTLYIRSLRVTARTADQMRSHQRLTAMLDAARLQPSGLPPSAILCVRQLRDPRPGIVRLGAGDLRPPPEWERAVASALERIARTAARPALGPAPAAAEAVLFADRAELLACLAADWCADSLTSHWWWRSLLGAVDLTAAVVPAWSAAPEHIPAALQLLAARHEAVRFANRLDHHQAHTLLHATVATFGARQLQATLAEEPIAIDRQTHSRADKAESNRLPDSDSMLPPWHAWFTEDAADRLAPAPRLLLGIGLALHRAPTIARTSAFAVAIRRWRQVVASQPTRVVLPLQEITGGYTALTHVAADLSIPEPVEGGPTRVPPPVPRIGTPAASAQPSPTILDASPDLESSLAEAVRGESHTATHLPITPMIELPIERLAPALPPSSADVRTEWGGLFYLINLALHLELYGDFTSPAQPGIELPIWDFLALVGRRIAGPVIEADPLWRLLASLAGRAAHDPPGAAFTLPDRWRIPAEWLAPFPTDDTWTWSAYGGRLRVRHPAMFLILDLPRHGHPRRQLTRELANFDAPTVRIHNPAPIVQPPESTLECWLDWLVPYVNARLRIGLGLAASDDLATLLFAHPAKVHVTGSHLEIVLSLADLPIAVRLAGLDRDPGWMPAAGRIIQFHFTNEDIKP